jgi:chromosome segregation ATPase
MAERMDGAQWRAALERMAEWVREGQRLVDLLPRALEDNQRLQARVEAALGEIDRLRAETAALAQGNETLRADRDRAAHALATLAQEILGALTRAVAALEPPPP